MADIVAGFEAIRNNPHYSETHQSRTLYQVDRTFDYIQEKLIEMAAHLNITPIDQTVVEDLTDDAVVDPIDNTTNEVVVDPTEEVVVDPVDPNANPFVGKTLYVNPTYQANLSTTISTASGTTKTNLERMTDVSSAYWIDVKAKLHGTNTDSL